MRMHAMCRWVLRASYRIHKLHIGTCKSTFLPADIASKKHEQMRGSLTVDLRRRDAERPTRLFIRALHSAHLLNTSPHGCAVRLHARIVPCIVDAE